jgi:hypothetical protein
LVIGFIDYLEFITTSNYSAIGNSHTLQFTTACNKPSGSAVFTGRCLVTAINGGRSRTIPVPQVPASDKNSSELMNCSFLTK